MTTIMLSPPTKTPIRISRFQQPRRPPLIERRMQNADYSWDDAFCLLRSAICVLPSLARKTAHKKTPLTPSRGREVLGTPAVPPGFRPSTAELKRWKVGG